MMAESPCLSLCRRCCEQHSNAQDALNNHEEVRQITAKSDIRFDCFFICRLLLTLSSVVSVLEMSKYSNTLG